MCLDIAFVRSGKKNHTMHHSQWQETSHDAPLHHEKHDVSLPDRQRPRAAPRETSTSPHLPGPCSEAKTLRFHVPRYSLLPDDCTVQAAGPGHGPGHAPDHAVFPVTGRCRWCILLKTCMHECPIVPDRPPRFRVGFSEKRSAAPPDTPLRRKHKTSPTHHPDSCRQAKPCQLILGSGGHQKDT